MFKSVTFSRDRLEFILTEIVELAIEYRDHHGCEEPQAVANAVADTMEGMDATAELIESGEANANGEKFHQYDVIELDGNQVSVDEHGEIHI